MSNRHPDNTNLLFHYGNNYRGLPILDQYSPFIVQYLDASYDVLHSALQCHSQVSAFRVDLHYPAQGDLHDCAYGNKPISDFMESLKNQIAWEKKAKSKLYDRVHNTTIHYIWCREIGENHRPHYHLVILFNRQAYDRLGKFDSKAMNMANRMYHAWSRATGIDLDIAKHLVQFPREEPVQYAYLRNPDSIGRVYERMSYLCKAYGKFYASKLHCFGYSNKYYSLQTHLDDMHIQQCNEINPDSTCASWR